MSPPTIPHQHTDVVEDWLLIQSAVGDALRLSREETKHERLPGCFALLLLRLAFAQLIHDFAREEANGAGGDQEGIRACIPEHCPQLTNAEFPR